MGCMGKLCAGEAALNTLKAARLTFRKDKEIISFTHTRCMLLCSLPRILHDVKSKADEKTSMQKKKRSRDIMKIDTFPNSIVQYA